MRANLTKHPTPYRMMVDANKQYRQMVSRRIMMATALMLSDLFGFGNARVNRALKGLAEIINGYAVFSATMNRDMANELWERGIDLPEEFTTEE